MFGLRQVGSSSREPEAALADSNIGCRRGFVHALGALAERDDYVLCVLIRVCLRALWWHLPQCLWRPVLALWCVYQIQIQIQIRVLARSPVTF